MKEVQDYGNRIKENPEKFGIPRNVKFGASKGWANKLLLRFKEREKTEQNLKTIRRIEDDMRRENLNIITQ